MYKIYRLLDNTNDNVYIGQTRQKYLSQRLSSHIYDYKHNTRKCTSRHIIKNGDYRIELIEETDDKMRERYWVLNTECINKQIPGRTEREYREDNKDKSKEYREKNKEKTKEYQKEYREDNKEKIKDYYKNHLEKQKEYYKNRYNWYRSMGGRPDYNNMSLLKIDPNLFN